MLGNLFLQIQTVVFLGVGAERDMLFVALSIPMFLNTLMSAAFGAVITPTVLRETSFSAQHRITTWILTRVAAFSGVAALLLAAGGKAIATLMAPGFSEDRLTGTGSLLEVAAVNVPLQAALCVLSGYFIAKERVALPSLAQVFGIVTTIIIVFSAGALSAFYIVIAVTLGNLLCVLLLLTIFTLAAPAKSSNQPASTSTAPGTAMLRRALPLSIATAVARANPIIERNVASHHPGVISSLGYANQLMSFLVAATTAPVATATYAQMCIAWHENRISDITRFVHKGAILVLAGGIAVAGVVSLVIEPLLNVAQPYTRLTLADVEQIAEFCRLLMPAYLGLALASFFTRPLYAAGLFFASAMFDCISIGVYALAAIGLGSTWAGAGLAQAMAVYGVFHAGLMFFVLRWRLRVFLGRRFVTVLVALAVNGALAYWITSICSENFVNHVLPPLWQPLAASCVFLTMLAPATLALVYREQLGSIRLNQEVT